MPDEKPIATSALKTPIGELTLAAGEDGLIGIGLANHRLSLEMGLTGTPPARANLKCALAALSDYFAGQRRDFDDLKLAPRGTAFQLNVWRALYKIPYGETRSYGEIAREIGLPRAMRAVGMANGRNPLPIIVPCHRVIGANGTLTGFGGGLPAKKFLLEFEAEQSGMPGTQLTANTLMQWRDAL
jgi:methylated-DNA-[protein]-cysteine S-methyltransferase